MASVLLDTGPLTALLNPNDEFHSWARDVTQRLPAPLLTSEPVLAETFHLLRRDGCGGEEVFALAEEGVIRVGIRFEEERVALRQLMARYRNVPMSLADATLVRLSELHRDCLVFTLDADFRIYRRHGNRAIPALMPER
jgi:predicted nucleic acid-binding protein